MFQDAVRVDRGAVTLRNGNVFRFDVMTRYMTPSPCVLCLCFNHFVAVHFVLSLFFVVVVDDDEVVNLEFVCCIFVF